MLSPKIPQSSSLSSEAHVQVLLPVYNGARFLPEQIESILGQTGVHVLLLCRDDDSSDTSAATLRDFETRFPRQVRILRDDLGNLGASGNFSRLMQAAMEGAAATQAGESPPYIALSDQDDLWHSDKLATCVAHIQSLEKAHPGMPALVHSDLRLISEVGDEIAPSMARYQGLQPQHSGLSAQVLSNTLTGCTSLMNRSLLETGLPVPQEAIMHDWWLSLVASALGQRTYLDQALIDYRQHASNAIGAKAQDAPVAYRTYLHRVFDDRHSEIFRLNARQAGAFLERFKERLSARQRLVLWLAKHLDIPFPPLQRLTYRLLRKL
jgi:glycosyltransferase involved in cell wall biosynthesis